jgi:hypothetical protein
MSIITLIITLAIIGFLMWLVMTYIPMPEPFKKIIIVIVIFAVVLWLLYGFGLLGAGPQLRFNPK